jgi:hypothetical protein
MAAGLLSTHIKSKDDQKKIIDVMEHNNKDNIYIF